MKRSQFNVELLAVVNHTVICYCYRVAVLLIRKINNIKGTKTYTSDFKNIDQKANDLLQVFRWRAPFCALQHKVWIFRRGCR